MTGALDNFAFLLGEVTPLLIGIVFLPIFFEVLGHNGTIFVAGVIIAWMILFPVACYYRGLWK